MAVGGELSLLRMILLCLGDFKVIRLKRFSRPPAFWAAVGLALFAPHHFSLLDVLVDFAEDATAIERLYVDVCSGDGGRSVGDATG